MVNDNIVHYIAYMQYNESSLCAEKYMYTSREIGSYLEGNYEYKIRPFVSMQKFIENSGFIQEIILKKQGVNIPEKLYYDKNKIKATISPVDIAINLKVPYFLTGYYIFSELGLTEYAPKVIHVDWIRPKGRNKHQGLIDNEVLQQIAFKPKRETSRIISYDGYQIYLLNGKYFGENPDEYTINMKISNANCSEIKTLKLEKLMIESLINYQYFGGADLVWEVFMKVKNDLNLSKLIEYYKECDYQYPYQNALGYLLETASADREVISYFEKNVNKNIKFHLFIGDSERRIWNEKWNLYVPKRFT